MEHEKTTIARRTRTPHGSITSRARDRVLRASPIARLGDAVHLAVVGAERGRVVGAGACGSVRERRKLHRGHGFLGARHLRKSQKP